MRVSIIGAGRRRNGIGQYLGKYFHLCGAEVTSVLGTTPETSRAAAVALRRYGISALPGTNLRERVEADRPDALVIASPSRTHYGYLSEGAEMGLNLFCEKPFVWQNPEDPCRVVERLLMKAREQGVTVAMNSQWPFVLGDYEALCGKIEPDRTTRFSMLMSPFSPGREMIPESLPHVLSLLYCSLGGGEAEDIEIESHGEGEMVIRFIYVAEHGCCEVTVRLASKKDQPREMRFGFDGRIVSRRIDPGQYDIYFQYEDREMKLVDPISRSVMDFMEAVEKKREPLIGPSHILHNVALLKKIYEAYESTHPRSWKS